MRVVTRRLESESRSVSAQLDLPLLRLGRGRALRVSCSLALRPKPADDLRPLCRDGGALLRGLDLGSHGRNAREARTRCRRTAGGRPWGGAAVVDHGRGEGHEPGRVELRDLVLVRLLLLVLLLRLALRKRLAVEELCSLRNSSVGKEMS